MPTTDADIATGPPVLYDQARRSRGAAAVVRFGSVVAFVRLTFCRNMGQSGYVTVAARAPGVAATNPPVAPPSMHAVATAHHHRLVPARLTIW